MSMLKANGTFGESGRTKLKFNWYFRLLVGLVKHLEPFLSCSRETGISKIFPLEYKTSVYTSIPNSQLRMV